MIDIPKNVFKVIALNNNFVIASKDGVLEKKSIYNEEYSDTIVESREEFINGFKLVKFEDGRYGYVKGDNNEVLPYRYECATDFNEYGYAIVIYKNSDYYTYATWINNNFERFDAKSISWNNDSKKDSEGFIVVSAFSEGKRPVSKLEFRNNNCTYFNTNGEIIQFDCGYKMQNFFWGTEFKKSDYAIVKSYIDSEPYVVFSNGYSCSIEELMNIIERSQLIPEINEKVENAVKKKRLEF